MMESFYLPCNNNVQRLKCDMHTGTHPSTKTKAAETVIDEPGVVGFQEPFRYEFLAFGKYLWIEHNSPKRRMHKRMNS